MVTLQGNLLRQKLCLCDSVGKNVLKYFKGKKGFFLLELDEYLVIHQSNFCFIFTVAVFTHFLLNSSVTSPKVNELYGIKCVLILEV